MVPVRLSRLECELPGPRIDDETLALQMGIAAATAGKFSRGRIRHFAPDGVGPSHLAASAAERLLEALGLAPQDLDLILFATTTPDFFFPGSACLLQGMLGAATVGCLDLRSQCTGFLNALDVGRRFVVAQEASRVLVVAAEVPSHMVRFDGEELELSCATTDGAVAGLLEKGPGAGELLACNLFTDGSRHRDLWCEFPASRHFEGLSPKRGRRVSKEHIEKGLHFPKADLAALAELALERLPVSFTSALEEAKLTGVDATIVCHLDPRVQQEVHRFLGGKAGRPVAGKLLYSFGASLPLALGAALEGGDVVEGETVALLTAGSGASWGAGIIRT